MENQAQIQANARQETVAMQQPVAAPIQGGVAGQVYFQPPVAVSDRKKGTAAALCFFLGGFGAHRFYTGKVGSGVGMILTFGGLGIWTLVDFICILVGSFKDYNKLPLK